MGMSETALRDLNTFIGAERNSEACLAKHPVDNASENIEEWQKKMNGSSLVSPHVNGNHAVIADSGGKIGIVEVEYIESENLNDVEDIDTCLKTILAELDSKDWVLVCDALNNVLRQSIFHKEAMGDMLGNGDLNFVRNETVAFDLQDLLRASAEVLGSGSFGSTYKAMVLSGPVVVVKRFKHMNRVGIKDFFDHMRKLGSLLHPNLLPLVAFYYGKEDKLLVHDYAENGNLASHLHGRRGFKMDWPTRLKQCLICSAIASSQVFTGQTLCM